MKRNEEKEMEELLEILQEVKPGVDFENDTDLIGHGVLDSITMVTLVLELNDAFDIEITPVDIVPENFKTVQTIQDMIQRLSEE
jgi:hypothetical protein